ncbi:MAG: hypothetical protein U0893_08605 [Chloroflexota bacterium]
MSSSLAVTPPASQAAAGPFPLGMFEDNNILAGDTARFSTMIDDLRAHGLDTVLFTNSSVQYHSPLLNVSDSKGFNTVFAPMHELSTQFLDDPAAPATIEKAREVVYPLAQALRGHTSLQGYNLRDDSTVAIAPKLALAIQAFREADSVNAPTAIIPVAQEAVYATARPANFLTYYYPAKTAKQPCDWGFSSPTLNLFSQSIRSTTRDKDPQAPTWLILQTQGLSTAVNPAADPNQLRIPTPEEVRLQQWLALGEGAHGTFWFIYSSQPGRFVGVKDNPSLYDEVGAVTQRVAPLRSVLGGLQKTDDLFDVNGSANRYVSTLADAAGKLYVIAANASCTATQSLSVTSSTISAQLRDVETNQVYDMNAPISFRPGDGKLLEVVNIQGPTPTPTPTVKPNLIQNASFEQVDGSGQLVGWGGTGTIARDTAVSHSGGASMRIQGSQPFSYRFQSLGLKPGTLHTVSYWIKTQSVAGTGVSWRWVNLAPTFGLSNGQVTTGTADWRQVSSTFMTAPDLTSGRIDLTWALSGGTAWIDDVVLCEGRTCEQSSAPAPTPTPGGGTSSPPTSTPAPTATATPVPTSTAKPNLIRNSSFEQVGPSGQLADWGGSGQVVRDTTVAHTGAASMRVQGAQPYSYRFQAPALRAGVLHTISYWIKTQNVGGTGFAWRWANLTPSLSIVNGTPTTSSANWTQVVATFTPAANYTSGRLDLGWAINGGSIWIDDVVLCEGTVCQP